jgi:hypothetical protein
MTNETRSIEAADIVDFAFKIQEAILDGYRLSDVSDFAPQNIGWVYITTMTKAGSVSIGSLALTVNVDTEQALTEITKIAQETGQYDLTPDQQDIAAKIAAGAITVEPNIAAPKQPRQPRGRK